LCRAIREARDRVIPTGWFSVLFVRFHPDQYGYIQ